MFACSSVDGAILASSVAGNAEGKGPLLSDASSELRVSVVD